MNFNEINLEIKNSTFHHFGIGVNKIYEFNRKLDKIKIFDPLQNVNVAFFNLNNFCIEVVEPVDNKSPVYNSLKNNINYTHLCYETFNYDETILSLKSMKFIQISKPVIAKAFNKEIVWFKHLNLGLLEIIINE